MKKILLNTLLSTSLLTSTMPLFVTTACNNSKGESIPEDYTSSIDPYEPQGDEKNGVTDEQALAIFLKAENCEKIYLEDTKDIISKQIKSAKKEGGSGSANLKMSNISINKESKTISLDVYVKLKIEMGESFDSWDAEYEAKVENVPLQSCRPYSDYIFQVSIYPENGGWLDNSKIEGYVSGKFYSSHDKKWVEYSGKKQTITKTSTSGEESDLLVGAVANFTGCSYYLSKLTRKA